MWLIPALAGASIALGAREWVEYYMRQADKRRNCYHEFLPSDDTVWMGSRTQHCWKCGYQQFVPKEEDT